MLCLRAKGSVPQEAADKFRDLIESKVEIHQTIGRMEQAAMVEAMISCEKSRMAESMQQRDDVCAIFHPQTTNFSTNLPEVDLASAESLTFDDAGGDQGGIWACFLVRCTNVLESDLALVSDLLRVRARRQKVVLLRLGTFGK